MEMGDRPLRIGGVEEKTDVEPVRDLLDEPGLVCEHVRFGSGEGYPFSVCF